MRVSIPPSRYTIHVALVSSIHGTSSCSLEERCNAPMEDEVDIDPKVVIDGGIIEHKSKVDGFYQREEVVDGFS